MLHGICYFSLIKRVTNCFISLLGARCCSVVRVFAHGVMGHRIDPSWGGPIELFIVPVSAPRLVKKRPWYVLSCLLDDAYKRTLAANRKSSLCGGSRFPLSLSEWSFTICLTPYNHKLKNVLSVSLNKTFPSFFPISLLRQNRFLHPLI